MTFIKKQIFKKALIASLVIIFAFVFQVAFGQVATLNPRQINISAHIVNNSNKEITNGDYTIRFAIYSQDREINDPYPSTTDQRLWEETQTVKLRNGYLEAFVGSINPIPKEVNFTNGNYYLGIRINSDSEMVPRKRIGAVPLAFNSFQLQGAEIGTREGNIPLLGAGGLLDVAMMPPVTDLGTIAAGVWEGDIIADEFIADALTGKTYNGFTLTTNNDGFSIAGGDTERTLTLTGGNVILNVPGAAGSIAYSTGTGYAFSGVGAAGQVLTSSGNGMPTWQSVAGVGETDPIFNASTAAGIAAGDISNWDSAFGWGNHGAAGYVTGTPWTSLGYITDGNTGWDNSYGFITSADDTVSGTELDGTFSSNGILVRTGAGTYTTTTNNSSNWDSAFGWGNHASAGYVTGTPWTSLGYITDGNTGWDNSYGFITDLSTFTTDDLAEGSTNLYSQWITTGSDIYYNTGNIGIGDTTPSVALDVAGDVQIQGGELYLNGITSSASTTEGTIYYDNDDDKLYVYSNGGWQAVTGSSRGTFTGKTASSYDGNFVSGGDAGYRAATLICAAEFPDSHFCFTGEMLNSIAENDIVDFSGTAWIAEGPPGYTANSNDCSGYSTNSNTYLGAFWEMNSTNGGKGWLTNCSQTKPLACCNY